MSRGACNCCDDTPLEALVTFEMRTATAADSLPDWDPPYSGAIGGTVAMNMALEDGTIYPGTAIDVRYGEWRIAHDPTLTCFLRVWIRTWTRTYAAPTWTPPISDAESYADSVYEWNGTGNPCLSDPSVSVDNLANWITGAETAVAAPGLRTEIDVEILKYSYVDGYEPDISDPGNMQPNGFPNPLWEPAPP